MYQVMKKNMESVNKPKCTHYFSERELLTRKGSEL